jgi:hypothetical protein
MTTRWTTVDIPELRGKGGAHTVQVRESDYGVHYE